MTSRDPQCNFKSYIAKAIAKHGSKYNYSMFSYVGAHYKGSITCNIHGNTFNCTFPDHIRSNYGCCHRCWLAAEEAVFINHLKLHRPDVTLIGMYCGTHSKTQFLFQCGHKPYVTPGKIRSGRGCSICRGLQVDETTNFAVVHPDLALERHPIKNKKPPECFSPYSGKMAWWLYACGHDGCQKIADRSNGCGCRVCFGNIKKSKEQYLEEISSIHGNDVIPIDPYNGWSTRIRHICGNCNHIWRVVPGSILSGSACPKCSASRAEKIIGAALREFCIEFETEKRFHDCKSKRPLPFDFYIEELNTCIEYDGQQHFVQIHNWDAPEKTQAKDAIKSKYCAENDINLIRIPYWVYTNGDLKEVLEQELCCAILLQQTPPHMTTSSAQHIPNIQKTYE